jgi:hypothetical protein
MGVNGIKMACNGLTKGFAVAENQVFSDGYGAAFMAKSALPIGHDYGFQGAV